MGKEVILNSTSKNYLQQTEELCTYLKEQVYQDQSLPPDVQRAVDEFELKKGELEPLLRFDWKKAAELLSGLEINKRYRQTPGEALYDLVMYHENNGERLLEQRHAWTSQHLAGGRLVSVSGFGVEGARVSSVHPDYSDDDIGVLFSRR